MHRLPSFCGRPLDLLHRKSVPRSILVFKDTFYKRVNEYEINNRLFSLSLKNLKFGVSSPFLPNWGKVLACCNQWRKTEYPAKTTA